MSYRPGIGSGMEPFGLLPGPPMIKCDVCGSHIVIKSPPPKWFLDGKAPPKWRLLVREDGTRQDLCPACLEKAQVIKRGSKL